jgi:hypothetical protein
MHHETDLGQTFKKHFEEEINSNIPNIPSLLLTKDGTKASYTHVSLCKLETLAKFSAFFQSC